LNSPTRKVTENSLKELEYHTFLAENLGVDVITIHAGGVYGDKKTALKRLVLCLKKLPKAILERLALENDDKNYTPEDLLPICYEIGLPLVYDVHHHRCLKDSLSEEEATQLAIKTWNRECKIIIK
jgi:UV DNA damage endonuclease